MSRVWHPNTQMSEWDKFCKIRRAQGVWLEDSRGRKMIDGVASMWCNVWGHSEPELVGAIARQAKKLQHAPLFNLTHEPAEDLAKRLAEMSPGMHRVFFSDNGSSAMEVAIKIAVQCSELGGKKARIAALKNGYHGDTFGAMSAGYVPEFFSRFRSKLFAVSRLPVPNNYRPPRNMTVSDHAEYCLDAIEKRLAGGIDVMLMESGAQMAGGAIIYPAGFQKKVGRLCKKYGALLVLDEVATGFGRLGDMVQYEAQGCSPDIISYGKMLTGGYLTMAATLATKKVYDSFLGKFADNRHLFHGHTYTGNPIAAAVAIANLAMYRKRGLIKKIQRTSRVFEEYSGRLREIGMVGDTRHRGMLMGIELVSNRRKKTPISPDVSINRIFFEEGRRNGVYLRTLGNIVMLVPPLAISEQELQMLLERTIQTIRNVESQII